MDITLIVNIGVAAGTIALAVSTFVMTHQGKSQLEEIKKQRQISLSREEPRLHHSDLKFDDNKISLRIANVGNGIAMEVGVISDFSPLMMNLPFVRIKLEDKNAIPAECINFPVDGEMVLEPKSFKIFKSEIKFFVSTELVEKSKKPPEGLAGTAFDFEELCEFLKKQNIDEMGVNVRPIGKNFIEEPIDGTSSAEFTVDFKKHKTLEEAFKEFVNNEKKMPYISPVNPHNLEWLPGLYYRNQRRINR